MDPTTSLRISLETQIYTETSPTHEHNEDFVLAGDDFVIVLDGATPVPGLETGCLHDVPWLVRSLGLRLAAALTSPSPASLAEILEVAIAEVCDAHAPTCDLTNPSSPSSTVALLRVRDGRADYLALADSSVVFEMADDSILAITDDRLDHLGDYSVPAVAEARNTVAGFWVASTAPEAARHAVTGSLDLTAQPVRAAAVLSDGAATLVERHGRSWAELLSVLESSGPAELVRRTRDLDETATGRLSGKRHDDATAAWCRFTTPAV